MEVKVSLILDALKKAEHKHRMGDVPGIGAAQHDDTPRRSSLLGLTLLGVVAVSMLAFGIYLGEKQLAKPADKQLEPAIDLPPPTSMYTPGQIEILGQPPVVDSKPENPKQDVTQSLGKDPKPEPGDAEPLIELPEPVVKSSKSPVKPKVEERPPIAKHLNELSDAFVSKLPTLNIDIHSYDEQPGRSYALINMEKYREGDYLVEGPLLSEILPDGVVLEFRGERFILPIGN